MSDLPNCFHCGLVCPDKDIIIADKDEMSSLSAQTKMIPKGHKIFCCHGCKIVYQILSKNNLTEYYNLNQSPGVFFKEAQSVSSFDYLDDPDICDQFHDFQDEKQGRVSFLIPQIHCSSCVWLLENLFKLDSGIVSSQVVFLQKKILITYNKKATNLKKIIILLSSLGYEPKITLDSLQKKKNQKHHRQLYLKIGVAGFSFGNIMLLSFPDYLLGHGESLFGFKVFFSYLNIILSIPVLLYSAKDYFLSAFKAVKNKTLNLDVPLSIGILTLFLRSLFDILGAGHSGYLDSFAGLVFFLLLGKLFQQKTFDSLNFERDYQSYFPISVTKIKDNTEFSTPLSNLKKNDLILVRNNEIIPADSILESGKAYIDYSFVTGESHAVYKKTGDLIYAGGRQVGHVLRLRVKKEVSQSYLTSLWNNYSVMPSTQNHLTTFLDKVARYFTPAVLFLALVTALYWSFIDLNLALKAFSSVLIIACPCALALTAPFALGNALRIFSKNNLYLKNTDAIEKLARLKSIVFDKTGTLTEANKADVSFVPLNKGQSLSPDEINAVASLARQSAHPLSQKIYLFLNEKFNVTLRDLKDFSEISGRGLRGMLCNSSKLRVEFGSKNFIGVTGDTHQSESGTQVWLSINGKIKGCFLIKNFYRRGLENLFDSLSQKYSLYLLSGDSDYERPWLRQFFSENNMCFYQSPHDKLNYLKTLNSKHSVMMVGDGLNDAGALKSGDVGLVVTEDLNNFTPSSDAVLLATNIERLDSFLEFAKKTKLVIWITLCVSLLYNIAGLSFAITGHLSPLISAILMPISSISVMLLAVGLTSFFASRLNLTRMGGGGDQ